MFLIEMTDTFGGETNYSWVKRIETDNLDFYNRKKMINQIKKLLEIEGAKLRINQDCGDFIRYDIKNTCICIMVSVNY